MNKTPSRIARIVHEIPAWAISIAFVVTVFTLVNGRTTRVDEAIWIGCFSVQTFAVVSIGVGVLRIKSDRDARRLMLFALVDIVLVVATFCAMQASPL